MFVETMIELRQQETNQILLHPFLLLCKLQSKNTTHSCTGAIALFTLLFWGLQRRKDYGGMCSISLLSALNAVNAVLNTNPLPRKAQSIALHCIIISKASSFGCILLLLGSSSMPI
jgi:hypothetical protein